MLSWAGVSWNFCGISPCWGAPKAWFEQKKIWYERQVSKTELYVNYTTHQSNATIALCTNIQIFKAKQLMGKLTDVITLSSVR